MNRQTEDSPAPCDLRSLLAGPPERSGMLILMHELSRLAGTAPGEADAPERLRRAFERLRERGYAGLVSNVSLRNYLQDEGAWTLFGQALAVARDMGLRLWVYDESGYPSGTAGGRVPREHPEFEAIGLVRLVDDVPAGPVRLAPPLCYRYAVTVWAELDGGRLDLGDRVQEDGTLVWEAPAPCRIERYVVRTAFEGTHATLNVAAVRRYINVLDPGAVRAFLELTFPPYFDRFPDGMAAVDAVFTDEPSFMTTYHPALPTRYVGEVPVEDPPDPNVPCLPMLPWWEGLPEAFRQRLGYDLLPHLRLLFEDGDGAGRLRQDFHELLARQYAAAFFGQFQAYLEPHGIALVGHVLHEEPLLHHAGSEGSTMLALAPMRIPGCDILSGSPRFIVDSLRLLTPKYASSVAHLYGRREVMSEASDWEERNRKSYASLAQRRGALALQAMLGVTTFTSYFQWKEFSDEEIRQLVSCVNRVTSVVRRGAHVAGIALLYPIRSVWSRFVPTDHWVGPEQRPPWLVTLEQTLYDTARGLLASQRDFDFIDEDLLLKATLHRNTWHIADEAFSVLILLPGTVLAERAAERIGAFLRAGGTVVAFRPEPVVRFGRGLAGREEPLGTRLGADRSLHLFDPGDPAWLEAVAKRVPPAVALDPPAPGLFVRRSRADAGQLYLIVNTAEEPYTGSLTVEAGDAPPEAVDPWTGESVPVSPFAIEAYGVRIVLVPRLPPEVPEEFLEAADRGKTFPEA